MCKKAEMVRGRGAHLMTCELEYGLGSNCDEPPPNVPRVWTSVFEIPPEVQKREAFL